MLQAPYHWQRPYQLGDLRPTFFTSKPQLSLLGRGLTAASRGPAKGVLGTSDSHPQTETGQVNHSWGRKGV